MRCGKHVKEARKTKVEKEMEIEKENPKERRKSKVDNETKKALMRRTITKKAS